MRNRITIRQMLQHTSGIYDYLQSPTFQARVREAPLRELGVAEVVGYVMEGEPSFAPGEGWSYSNSNYYLLGAILERVSGETLADLLQARITEPLALASTGYEPAAPVADLLPGYGAPFAGPGVVTDTYDPTLAGPAGAMTSTAGDLLSFLRALESGARPPSGERDAWLTTIPASGGVSYGLAVMSFPLPGHASFGHTGSIWGYESFAAFFPDDGIRLVVVLNQTGADVNAVLVEMLGALDLL